MQLRVAAAQISVSATAVAIFLTSAAYADTVREDQWHLDALKVAEAHKISTGEGVTVGVADSGVFPHPDLRNNLLDGEDVATHENNKGQVDDVGHGTSMAGIIAAHGRSENSGVQGLAPQARVLPVRDSTHAKGGNTITVGNAIKWAVENSATVVNVSSTTGPSLEMQEALEAAKANDVVIVAGAGNTTSSAEVEFPAAAPGVLAVGSTNRSGKHSTFSIRGEQVQICAPGEDILTTRTGGGYVSSRGTSPAAAIVSGAAALVRAKFPDLSAPEVIHRLTATADDIGPPGRDDECGFGGLNIVKALTADVPPLAGPSSSLSPGAPPSRSAGSKAQPEANNTSAAVIGGIGAGVLLVGGIVALLVIRRQKDRPARD